LGILGIIVYFMSEDGGLQKLILDMKELKRIYSGVNIVKELWAVIKDLSITVNLRYFVSNSYIFNDIILKELSRLLSVYGVIDTWDLILYRLRCNGHVVNLVVIINLIFNLRSSIYALIF